MKQLDFNPAKSKDAFRKNYRLHDIAEEVGKNLLVQWGFEFEEFGKDKRYERVWEKGKDKPDLLIKYKDKKALLDWKGKHSASWIANTRAVEAYEEWGKKFNFPVLICFFVFDKKNKLLDRRFASVGVHPYQDSKGRQWDKNKTVDFGESLPSLTKANLLSVMALKKP